MKTPRLLEKIILKGRIKAETGLQIGGSPTALEIGGVDNRVMKDHEGKPYIPGPSLKGKMRSLLEKAAGIEWWLEEEWQTFISRLGSRRFLQKRLKEAWENFIKNNEMEKLQSRINDHIWIRPSTEIDSVMHPGFKGKYIQPLLQFKHDYVEIHTILKKLFTEVNQIKRYELEQTHQKIKTAENLSLIKEISTSELKNKLKRLNTLLGDLTPETVTAVGVWPEDKQFLRKDLKKLIFS